MIAILLMMTMIACVRPASTENDVDANAESQVDSIIRSAATQTAIAAEGLGGGASLENEMTAVGIVSTTEVTVEPTEVPATATPVPTPVEVVPNTYTIQEGEFPFCLARRFDIKAETLLSVNSVASGQVFYPGYNLVIPQDAGQFVGNRQLRTHPVESYTVQSGETFSSIACLFGDLYPESIAAANLMDVTDTLVTGSTIIIP